MLQEECTVTASTKRNSDLGGGKKGAATTYLSGLAITPLWPAGEGTLRTLNLNSPREAKECYHCPDGDATLPDVKEGDFLVINSVSYPIRFVGEWTDDSVACLHIVVTEVKA